MLDVYYIPENIIEEYKLPKWFKGCNCIGKLHPLHLKHKVDNLCVNEKVNVISCSQLFYDNKVKGVKYLKIDTEGHDCVILKSLYNYIRFLPPIFFPKKILFESNEHTTQADVEEIITLFSSIGYKLLSRAYDTIIVYDK
jgi:hypothetical protein